MSQFLKLSKKNTVSEQTHQLILPETKETNTQPFSRTVSVYSEQTTQKVNTCFVQIEPISC